MWPFNARNKEAKTEQAPLEKKLPRPKDILDRVGQYLVVQGKQHPDWVWCLKSVTRPSARKPGTVDFRVFDPHDVSSNGLAVRNYYSLDQRPNLILYHGWLDAKAGQLEVIPGPDRQQQAS